MKKPARSNDDPGPRLHSVNQYLEKNFPDFFAEARFQVGNDDYFLYARFGKYLASSIEHRRFKSDKISRGFTVLNKEAELKVEVRNIFGRKHEEFQQAGANRIEINTYDVGTTIAGSLSVTF